MSKEPITIFRGDDTDAFGSQTVVLTLNTTLPLDGCSAVFRFLDFEQKFSPIPEDKRLVVSMTGADTSKFPPGTGYASLRLVDGDGRVRTIDSRILVSVSASTACAPEGTTEVTIDVSDMPQILGEDSFDMLSDDWSLRQLVTKLAKHFGLKVTNESLPE